MSDYEPQPHDVARNDQRDALESELLTMRHTLNDADYAKAIVPKLSALPPRELVVLAARLIHRLEEALR